MDVFGDKGKLHNLSTAFSKSYLVLNSKYLKSPSNGTVINFASRTGDRKVGEVTDGLIGCAAFQWELSRIGIWAKGT